MYAALLKYKQEHVQALDCLRRELTATPEQEKEALLRQHGEEMGRLRDDVMGKEAQLARLEVELTQALGRAEEKGRELGKMEGEMVCLREALEGLRRRERELRERENCARGETEQLKVWQCVQHTHTHTYTHMHTHTHAHTHTRTHNKLRPCSHQGKLEEGRRETEEREGQHKRELAELRSTIQHTTEKEWQDKIRLY